MGLSKGKTLPAAPWGTSARVRKEALGAAWEAQVKAGRLHRRHLRRCLWASMDDYCTAIDAVTNGPTLWAQPSTLLYGELWELLRRTEYAPVTCDGHPVVKVTHSVDEVILWTE